jgi:hypothetical protein
MVYISLYLTFNGDIIAFYQEEIKNNEINHQLSLLNIAQANQFLILTTLESSRLFTAHYYRYF